ncbi:MAG: TraR/DksA C4-type zinc finger protein [Elusimicrobia bacterium]|nr:TraR/DksA C4-type zinc finger protein [Elusimicrobiota bacterium]
MTTKAKKTAKKTAKAKAKAKPAPKAAAPAPAPAKPLLRKSKPMSKSDLESIRKQLLDQRTDVIEAMRRNKAEEIGPDTGDEADQAAASMDRDLRFELSDTERNTLDQIEGALRKMDKGNYGICEQCREPIEVLRLKAVPFARYCIGCQTGSEKAVSALQA